MFFLCTPTTNNIKKKLSGDTQTKWITETDVLYFRYNFSFEDNDNFNT